MTFDALASEYGWTDDQILDLTLSRLRMALRAIARRRKADLRRRHLLAEVHAKSLAQMFMVMATKKQVSAVQKAIKSISFWDDDDGKPARELPSAEALLQAFNSRKLQ